MIKDITLVNVQGHLFSRVEFPQTGVVRVWGPNSAGKTALFKILFAFIENRLHILDERKAWVRRKTGALVQTISFWTGHIITLKLAESPQECMINFARPNGELVQRMLSDKIIPELLMEIGLHYDVKRDISLHFYRAQTPPIITSTNGVTNYDLLATALADPKAVVAQKSLSDLLEVWKKSEEELRLKSFRIETQLNALSIIDESVEEERLEKLRRVQSVLSCLALPNIKPLQLPVSPKLYPLPISNVSRALSKIKPPFNKDLRTLDILSSLKYPFYIYKSVKEYSTFLQSIKDEVCPTCGESLL